MNFTSEYVQAIKDRIEFLKNPKKMQLKTLPEQ
jgi:hypothetical protein